MNNDAPRDPLSMALGISIPSGLIVGIMLGLMIALVIGIWWGSHSCTDISAFANLLGSSGHYVACKVG